MLQCLYLTIDCEMFVLSLFMNIYIREGERKPILLTAAVDELEGLWFFSFRFLC